MLPKSMPWSLSGSVAVRHGFIDNVSFADSTTNSRRCEKGVHLVIHQVAALDRGAEPAVYDYLLLL